HLTSTSQIYTLALHDALPIFLFGSSECRTNPWMWMPPAAGRGRARSASAGILAAGAGPCKAPDASSVNDCGPDASQARQRHGQRSEEHTSELQSRVDIVCRLL